MALEEIRNFVAVDGGVGLAGQPSAAQFADVRDAGYEVVINLAPGDVKGALPDEAALLAALRLDYHHIPVPWTAPEQAQYDAFEAAMLAAAGRRTFVHCQANYRVTAFYGLYAAARLGWAEPAADALIDRVWTTQPGFTMPEVWRRFIAEARQRATRAGGTG